jgi:plastocyanin
MRSAIIVATVAAAVVLAASAVVTRLLPHPAPEGVPVSPAAGAESASVVIQNEPMSVAQQMAGQTGVVEVVMTDKGFAPATVSTTIGGTVKLHVRNTSGSEHNLIIDQFGIVTRGLKPGEENYIEFTASQKGDWPMVSDAPGQVEPAFRATLKVE